MENMFGRIINCTLFIILFVWITSCAGTNTTGKLSSQNKSLDSLSQIIFLNYSIQKDNKEGYNIELINKIVADGKIKKNSNQISTAKEGDLKCLILDENKLPISTIIISDPFIKKVEYQQENGSLTSKEVILDSADFSIRMQLDRGSRYIAIERINPNDSSYLLLTEID